MIRLSLLLLALAACAPNFDEATDAVAPAPASEDAPQPHEDDTPGPTIRGAPGSPFTLTIGGSNRFGIEVSE